MNRENEAPECESKEIDIIQIDDDEIDHMLLRRIFKRMSLPNKLIQMSSSVEALEYLKNAGNNQKQIIFLDINMPAMNGHEFVTAYQEVIEDNPFICILTTSNSVYDHVLKEQKGVKKYILKEDLSRNGELVSDIIEDYKKTIT